MKKNNLAKRFMTVLFCMALICGLLCTAAAAGSSQGNKDYDVVFVLDNSSSMKTSDPHRLLHQVTELFVNSAPSNGNRFGAVIYAYEDRDSKTQYVYTHDLTNDVDEITRFIEKALTYEFRGTDIPLGLGKADELLQRSGSSDNDKAIILLTDGNNDFHARPQLELSADVDGVLDESKGYEIYAVGLNYDRENPVNTEYLRGISSPKKGFPVIISKDSQIKDAFDLIAADMYPHEEAHVDQNGNFSIENEQVIEAVLNISGMGTLNWKLTAPDGTVYTAPGGDISLKETENFTDITIFNPAVGQWNITYPQNSQYKDCKCLLSYAVSASAAVAPDSGGTKDAYRVSVQVFNSQNPITQRQDFFSKFQCTAEVFAPDGSKDGEIALNAAPDGYEGQYTPAGAALGAYTVRCTITGKRLNQTAPDVTFETTKVGVVHGGASTSSPNAKSGLPWWVWLLIGLGVVAVLIVILKAFIIKKPLKPPFLSGSIRYEWYNENDLDDHFPYGAHLTMELDLGDRKDPRVKERTVANAIGDPRFDVLTNVFFVAMQDDIGNAVNGIANRDESGDVSVEVSGMTVTKAPMIIGHGEQVRIHFVDSTGEHLRLEFQG